MKVIRMGIFETNSSSSDNYNETSPDAKNSIEAHIEGFATLWVKKDSTFNPKDDKFIDTFYEVFNEYIINNKNAHLDTIFKTNPNDIEIRKVEEDADYDYYDILFDIYEEFEVVYSIEEYEDDCAYVIYVLADERPHWEESYDTELLYQLNKSYCGQFIDKVVCDFDDYDIDKQLEGEWVQMV
ncbi:MAG: hypothetical protein VZS44_09120 [Bacilli bacterium]|nr:hypothetical protein [Bacilli bacterium]